MRFRFIDAHRQEFHLDVMFLGRTDAHEHACPLPRTRRHQKWVLHLARKADQHASGPRHGLDRRDRADSRHQQRSLRRAQSPRRTARAGLVLLASAGGSVDGRGWPERQRPQKVQGHHQQ